MVDRDDPASTGRATWISPWMDQVSDGIFVADEAGRYLEVNRRGCDLLGRTRDELLALRVPDVIVPEELRDRPVAFQRLAVGSSMLSERRLVRGDGSTFVAELSVTRLAPDRWLTIARDITARRDAADAARRAEASFRAVLDVLPDAVVVHRGGTVVYANATAARYMGVEHPSALVGTPILEVLHPDDRPLVRERIRTMVATGTPVSTQRERFVRRDGSSFVAEVVALPLRFDGEASLLAVARDITEREQMQAQLFQSERLASVGLLAAGVAHEINNPLAYALLNLERLADALREPSPDLAAALGYVADAEDGARRVQRIVRDLRTFARGVGDEVTTVDVTAVAHTALQIVTNELRFRARVRADVGEVPPVRANADRLTQVFVNLLLNAAHAIPEGRAEENEVALHARRDGALVRVTVHDTGVGIAPEHMARLFDPFFTTKPPGMGTGLGLAICHSIVASFGGRIEVESTPGAGSSFTVVLPVDAQPSRPRAPTPPPEAPPRPQQDARPRLLLVEDERNMRAVLQALLAEHYDVVAAATGREAQRRLEEDSAWRLVLCDLLMPDMSGMDLYDWVSAQRPALAGRMVFMTGGAFTERGRALLERCPGRWIEKPFDFEALLALLAAVPDTTP